MAKKYMMHWDILVCAPDLMLVDGPAAVNVLCARLILSNEMMPSET